MKRCWNHKALCSCKTVRRQSWNFLKPSFISNDQISKAYSCIGCNFKSSRTAITFSNKFKQLECSHWSNWYRDADHKFHFQPIIFLPKTFCANYTLRFSSNTYFLSNWASSLYKIFEGFMSLCFKNLTICCTTIGCTQCTHSLCGQLRNQHKWIEKAFSNYMTSTSNHIEKFLAFVVCTRQNFWRI